MARGRQDQPLKAVQGKRGPGAGGGARCDLGGWKWFQGHRAAAGEVHREQERAADIWMHLYSAKSW